LVGDGLTPLEIFDLDIPVRDRLWVLLRTPVIGLGVHSAIASIVERVLTCERNAGREPDARSWAVVPLLRRRACGEHVSQKEFDAEWDATWDAEFDVARAAARVAAWDAARNAEWDAAWDAAWDVGWYADFKAAWDEWLRITRIVIETGKAPPTPSGLTYEELLGKESTP
jgi:hypothetical protein